MFNQEIKENSKIKKSKELDEIQALRTLGIIWICLGASNPIFFILGLVFIVSSIVKDKRRKTEEVLIDGGLA